MKSSLTLFVFHEASVLRLLLTSQMIPLSDRCLGVQLPAVNVTVLLPMVISVLPVQLMAELVQHSSSFIKPLLYAYY